MKRRITITAIKAANKAAGYHFFDRDTLRFFNGRIERYVYQGNGGVYFVTSEQYVGVSGNVHPRNYTVREFDTETGGVHTVDAFNVIETLVEAQAIASAKAAGR